MKNHAITSQASALLMKVDASIKANDATKARLALIDFIDYVQKNRRKFPAHIRRPIFEIEKALHWCWAMNISKSDADLLKELHETWTNDELRIWVLFELLNKFFWAKDAIVEQVDGTIENPFKRVQLTIKF